MRSLLPKLLLIIVAVVGLWLGSGAGPHRAEARPTDILTLNPTTVNSLTAAACKPDCDLMDPAQLLQVANADGDGDGIVEPGDFAALGADGDLLPEGDGELWVLVFVSNDDNLHLDADEGVWLSSGRSSSVAECVPGGGIDDEDCDNDGTWDDRVVADLLSATDSGGTSVVDPGDATLTATQSGVDFSAFYSVTGEGCWLAISKNADMDRVAEGSLVSYTIDVRNEGTLNCPDVAIGDVIPADTDCIDAGVFEGLDVDPSDVDIEGCDIAGEVVWDNFDLDVGDEIEAWMTVKLTFGAQEGDDILNEACVSTAQQQSDCDAATVSVDNGAPVRGDVSCDGDVSMVDAMLIAQKVAGLIGDFRVCP